MRGEGGGDGEHIAATSGRCVEHDHDALPRRSSLRSEDGARRESVPNLNPDPCAQSHQGEAGELHGLEPPRSMSAERNSSGEFLALEAYHQILVRTEIDL